MTYGNVLKVEDVMKEEELEKKNKAKKQSKYGKLEEPPWTLDHIILINGRKYILLE